MMKKYYTFFALLCLIISYAQTVSVAVTHANCTGQGAAIANADGFDNPIYQFRDSGNNPVGSSLNSNSISSVDAGNYSVIVSGDGGVTQTVYFTIEDRYTGIPTPNVIITGLCDGSFSFEDPTTSPPTPPRVATLNVTMPAIPGKSYEYKVVLSEDEGFPESAAPYKSLTIPTNIPEFGIYQIRIKDECGEYVTITRNIQPSLAAITDIYMETLNNQACDSNTFQIKNLSFITAAGVRVPISEYVGGLKVEMWENPNPSGSACPTAVPSTLPIYTNVFTTTDPNGPTDSSFVIPVVPSGRYLIRVTTPCGEVRYMCENMNYSNTRRMDAVAINSGCGNDETLTISGKENNFFNFPVTVEVRNSSNVIVSPVPFIIGSQWELNNWSLSDLPMGNYTVRYTDNCGNGSIFLEDFIESPAANTDPITLTIHTSLNKCKREDPLAGTTITKTTQVTVIFNGYVENSVNAVVTILSGPSNVGVEGVRDIDTPGYLWDNMAPGNYVVQIDTLCGGVQTFPFTLSKTNSNLLRQSIVSKGDSYCSGGGTITSTIVYNGLYPTTVELLNSAGAVVQTSNSGNFFNIPAGTYYTRLKITPYCGAGDNHYYVDFTTLDPGYFYDNDLPIPTELIPIVLSDASTGVQVTKKIGIICEDAAGVPLTKGSAYFEISGALPITVQYRVKGSSDPYISFVVNTLDFEINDLDANVTYEILLTSCGKTNTTEVIIQSPGVITATNTIQPCINNPYTLSLPEYVGATYTWRNSAGTLLSSSRTYTFANYTAADDGEYNGTISWGTCVIRYVKLTLNSQNCGGPIDEVCYEPATTLGVTEPTKHGITALGRATGQSGNWPTVRNGAWTVLESNTKGFVINRIATTALVEAITNPVIGMMVYDAQADCLKINTDGTSAGWKCFNTQTCP